MKSYPSYDALALDLDLHFFDKISILKNAGNKCCSNRKWLVVTDDGCCHLFDKHGNLDNIKKITTLKEFYIQSDIRKIIIPDSITKIGEYVFFRCINLASVTIPDSVKSIGSEAFTYCNSLTSMVIPNSVKSIGHEAFANCSSLTSVTISDSVKSIGYSTFWDCENLKNIFFKGKTLAQVKAMKYYPWEIEDENVIKAELE